MRLVDNPFVCTSTYFTPTLQAITTSDTLCTHTILTLDTALREFLHCHRWYTDYVREPTSQCLHLNLKAILFTIQVLLEIFHQTLQRVDLPLYVWGTVDLTRRAEPWRQGCANGGFLRLVDEAGLAAPLMTLSTRL